MKIFRTEDSIISLENIRMISPTYEERTRTIQGKKYYATSIRLQYCGDGSDVDFVYSNYYKTMDECNSWVKNTMDIIEKVLIND